MVYFEKMLHTYACQPCLSTGVHKKFFLMDKALLSISQAGCGKLVNMLITLEPRGIFPVYTLPPAYLSCEFAFYVRFQRIVRALSLNCV